MTSIAFLGTGLLGAALAEAAAKRGDGVTAWNRTIAKARALEPFGVHVAASPAEAVRGARRVHLVLKDDDSIDEVVAALLPGLDREAVIVDHTTALPARTAERAHRLHGEGVHYLHCPVFIGPPAARQGKGTILACGPRPLFEQVEADLARMAERLEYLGERPDLAAVLKLCGNALLIGINALVADVLSVAAESDVTPELAMHVLELFNTASVIAGRGRRMASRDYAATFELAMARKDVRLMIETAGNRPLAVLPGLAARMDVLLAEGRAADDLAVMGQDAVR